ncbi:helix-turn-helix domain-containing protein [Frankia torreyi]|uniref:helix-turn-helix domain-containing protein n=1 Tax=Frankia torreyi TaxID=1856 RepID=UPI0009E2888C
MADSGYDRSPTIDSGAVRDGAEEWRRLGARLREVREYLNYSQQLVSDRTGIPRSAVSDIERGGRKVDSLELRKLSRLYNYPASYFLDESEDARPDDHALQALTRAIAGLSGEDKEEVLRFVEYLNYVAQTRNRPGR